METDWCLFETDSDGMCARIALKLPETTEAEPVTVKLIGDFLKEQGISSGIIYDVVEHIATTPEYGVFFDIARGNPPTPGEDGYYEFLVPMEDEKSKPVLNEDGSVDYYNSLKISEIAKDVMFARYIRPTSGDYGYNIFSKVVAPTPGKNLPPLKGKGFYTNDKKDEYYASYQGHIIHKDNTIKIEKIYIVDGDLDIDTGNIIFDGDVEIRGDIHSGLTIESNGNVLIHGHVASCTIKAADDITIKEGVQGRNNCLISAGRNVTCKFVERCTIHAGGSVYADSILDSYVSARNEVRVLSKSGVIIGGTTIGMMGVTAKELGNDAEIVTNIFSGPSKEDIVRSISLTESIYKYNENIETIDGQLDKYNAMTNPPPEVKDFKQKLLRAKVVIVADKTSATDELNALHAHINNARKRAKITVLGISYPGVKIAIENNYYQVMEAFKDVVYKMYLGKVVTFSGDTPIS